MNLSDLQRLANQGETQSVEFKKSTGQLKSACETACAFLNTSGGTILLGVSDEGKILGQEVADKTKREIGLELAKIHPVHSIHIDYVEVMAGKQVIVLRVETNPTKQPYTYDGRAYLRLQSGTFPMPMDHQQQLTLSNAPAGHWESLTLEDISIDDLDSHEIFITLKEGSLNGRIPKSYLTDDPELALQRLGLIENNKITNAALILFGKYPEAKYPQCLLRLARFRGTTNREFIDNKQVHGNIFKLLSEAIAFASSYLPIASTFPKDSWQRVDTPLFPITLYYHKIFESWGRGVQMIVEECLKAGHPEPFYTQEAGGTALTLPSSQSVGPTQLIAPETLHIKSPALTERQTAIINILKQHSALSTEGIRVLIKNPPSVQWLRTELIRLKKVGLVEVSGHTTTRKWHAV